MRTTPELRARTAAPFGRAGLEQLDHPGQAVGDVLADDAAGVEGPHGQLGARLTDGLGGDDADRLAELDDPVGGERLAVAGGADAVLGLAGEHRADPDPVDRGVVAERFDQLLGDQRCRPSIVARPTGSRPRPGPGRTSRVSR